MEPVVGWKRLLYIKQEYPDNYVDASFLENMERNVHVKPFVYSTVVLETLAISQQCSLVLFFIGVFIQLYQHQLLPFTLLSWSSCFTLLFYGIWDLYYQGLSVSLVKNEDKSQLRTFYFF